MVNKGVSKATAAKVIAAYGDGCWLGFPGCKHTVESIDHVLPAIAHGPTLVTNLRPACKHCNSARNSRMISGLGPTIHAVIGPPTAGKTTFVRDHCKSDDIVLDYDILANSLLPYTTTDEHTHAAWLTTTATAMWLASYNKLIRLTQPVHIWLIKTLPTTRKSPRLLDEWIALNYDVHVIDPGKHVIRERLSAYQRASYAWQGMQAWYKLGITQDNVNERMATRAHQLASYHIGVSTPIQGKQSGENTRIAW